PFCYCHVTSYDLLSLPTRRSSDLTAEQCDWGGALGQIDETHGDRVLPAEHAVHVGRAEVLGAVFAQVDAPAELRGEIAGGRRPQQVGGQDPQGGRHRWAAWRLRRNLIVTGAPVSSQASRNPCNR